jgi:hypothetical protein
MEKPLDDDEKQSTGWSGRGAILANVVCNIESWCCGATQEPGGLMSHVLHA